MEHLITKTLRLLTAAIFVVSLHSCYNDNVEELYPGSSNCDTTNVTYTNDVWPVINANCTVCHGGGFPSANVSLTNYNEIVTASKNGSLLGVIRHDAGWPPMPNGGGMLPDCNIKKIEIWINAGSPEN